MPISDPHSPFLNRQARLLEALASVELHTLVLNPGPSLVYLTGLHFHLSERPVAAIFSPGSQVILVIPKLENAKVAELPFPAQVFLYGEDPASWGEVFHQAAQAARLDGQHVGVEPTALRFLELRLLEAASPGAQFCSAEESLALLRMRKDEMERDKMRRAVEIAQLALLATLPQVKMGMSERELSSELVLQLLQAGSDSPIPFSPIVSSGPNSANPHAVPTDRRLAPGDLLVIDWGVSFEGYFSDLTRTFAIGDVDAELFHIAQIVKEANAAGCAAVRPGITAEEVDRAARAVIEQAGYGMYFTHRTGHGLGMEGHEPPYIRAGNPLVLESDMTFTIEPGIYLPNRNGVRIEDNVVVTEGGVECLSSLSRDLIRIPLG